MRFTSRWFRTATTVAPLLLAGCASDSKDAAPRTASVTNRLISDELHNGGTTGFFFLPPMVPGPATVGAFAPAATPTVRIDEITPNGRTRRTLATFTSDGGPRGEGVQMHRAGAPPPRDEDRDTDPGDYFYVRWDTRSAQLSADARYRVRVLIPAVIDRGGAGGQGGPGGQGAPGRHDREELGTREIGFADVDVVLTQHEFRSVDTVNFTPLLNGSVLRIKFRIDRPAVDADADGVLDWLDNCPEHANADQVDSDRDGQGDACECAGVTCRDPRNECRRAGVCSPRDGRCSGDGSVPDGSVCTLGHALGACRDGRCDRGSCATGYADCNGERRDGCETQTNTLVHCGACGVACTAGPHATPTCARGACALTCDVGWADANGDRADGCELNVTTDANCGRPGNACVSSAGHTSTCVRGACSTIACPAQRANCNTSASDGCEVDLTTDPAHCGACQRACAVPNATAACAAGACAVGACNAGFADCDGSAANGCETALADDVAHCGACGHACAPAHATPVCAAGACAVASCDAGFADCNGDPADGCEADLSRVTSCGACGAVCDLPHATPACTAGACAVGACAPGYADCNADAGCETSLASVTSCGGCGVVCPTGPNATPTCGAGGCGIACAPGFADCDGVASNGCEVDTTVDDRHCGACGTACANATTCQSGACTTAVCASGHADCNGLSADGCETTPASDPGHCGACGHACSFANAAAECVAGACGFSVCDMGYADCDGQRANGCEVALGNDARNCGGCGVRCAYAHATGVCGNGACALGTCDAGWADCNGDPADGCEVNLASDLAHCGSCGTACAAAPNASATCTAGACGIACATGRADCDGSRANGCETDTSSDLAHCGTCGTACTQGRTCVAGACTATACAAPLANCDGAEHNGCEVSTATDVMHCGACGHACAFAHAGASCAASACVMGACDAGWADCNGNPADGCEVDLLNDRSHCGGCGAVCTTAHGAAACAHGSCRIAACDAGYDDCDRLAFNGCEASTASDVNHCGACGAACPSRPSAAVTCHAGACGYTCVAGRADCDGDPANGCEVDAAADSDNCGGCGVVCTQGRTCQSGACTTAVCAAGQGDCDRDPSNGCEVSLATSAAHCGGCGVACGYANGAGVCTAGSCSLGACNAGFANCNASSADGCEVDTQSDASHCGACGLACAAPNGAAGCYAGACGVAACNAGFADCDGAAPNGCEANLATSAAHCGACGNACAAGQTCSGGTCAAAVATYTVGSAPRNVVVDAAGNAWVTNSGSNTVTKLSPSGATLLTVSGFSFPFGVAVASDGSVWVANFNSNRATHLSASGAVLHQVSTGVRPAQLAIDASGNVWVANFGSNSLTKIGPTGAVLGTFGGVSSPQFIAIDAAGDVWVGSQFTNFVYEFSPSGALLRQVSTGRQQNNGLAFDTSGSLWVTYSVGASITRLDPATGAILGSYPTAGGSPYAVRADRHGTLWVGNESNVARICGTAACGTIGAVLATYSAGPFPTDVTVDAAGNVWTANNGSNTVTELLGVAR